MKKMDLLFVRVVSRCFNYGNIAIDNIQSFYLYCGGICGDISLSTESGGSYKIEESANHGTIISKLARNGKIGGICGGSYMGANGTINKCYNLGEICISIGDTTATDIDIGGISGNGPTLNNCYNMGNVDVDIPSGNFNIGGLTGFAGNTVNNSYNNGKIEGDGLIGNKKANVIISNCYTNNYSPTEFYSTTVKNLSNDENDFKRKFCRF